MKRERDETSLSVLTLHTAESATEKVEQLVGTLKGTAKVLRDCGLTGQVAAVEKAVALAAAAVANLKAAEAVLKGGSLGRVEVAEGGASQRRMRKQAKR